MEDLLLSWRNIWRNPRRSILTILAVFFATALLIFMLSFQFGAYDDMISASVRLSTGHFQVQAEGYQDKPNIRKVIDQPGVLLEIINGLPGVENSVGRAETFALAAGSERSNGLLVTGVIPDLEISTSSLPGQIRHGRYLTKKDHGAGVIGVLAAKRLRIGIGDECTLIGQGRDGSVAATVLEIVGIYKTGVDEFDRSTVQIPLTDFDSIFSMGGGVNRIVVNVSVLGETDHLVQSLAKMEEFKGLRILSWDKLTPGLKQSIELDLIGGLIMYAILVLVVAFSILNTFFMAIFERTREFGVLMSIGTKPIRLVKIILMESLAMAVIGIFAGMIVGIGVTLFFSIYGIGLGESGELMAQYGFEDRLYPTLSLLSIVAGPIIIGIVTFITAIIPALKIPRMRPVDALRAC